MRWTNLGVFSVGSGTLEQPQWGTGTAVVQHCGQLEALLFWWQCFRPRPWTAPPSPIPQECFWPALPMPFVSKGKQRHNQSGKMFFLLNFCTLPLCTIRPTPTTLQRQPFKGEFHHVSHLSFVVRRLHILLFGTRMSKICTKISELARQYQKH